MPCLGGRVFLGKKNNLIGGVAFLNYDWNFPIYLPSHVRVEIDSYGS